MEITQPGRKLEGAPDRARRYALDQRVHSGNALFPQSSHGEGIRLGVRANRFPPPAAAGVAKARTQQKLGAATRASLCHGRDGFHDDNRVLYGRGWRPPKFLMRFLNYVRHSRSYGEDLKA